MASNASLVSGNTNAVNPITARHTIITAAKNLTSLMNVLTENFSMFDFSTITVFASSMLCFSLSFSYCACLSMFSLHALAIGLNLTIISHVLSIF